MFTLIIAKIVTWGLKLLGKSGSTWPGHIALKLNPNFLTHRSGVGVKVILIAGTNGKTTTSTLLRFLLEKEGKTVFQNEEGANLLNGIASSFVKHSTISGKLKEEYAVFEIDENSLPLILKQITPEAIIVLNLFRDQLDRYGEVNTIAHNWKESFKNLSKNTKLILNGDDPQIAYLGLESPADVEYFGLESSLMEQKEIPHDVDSVYCPKCGEKLEYERMSYSHLGNYLCNNCSFKRPQVSTYSSKHLETSLKGVYNIYNISAVFLTLEKILHTPLETVFQEIKDFKPAFGRQEVIQYKDRNVFLLLSKNPTGFNQSIEVVKSAAHNEKKTCLILLNDRIPDGKDISWIWDVEFQNLIPITDKIVVSGDRTYDMALRFKYCYEDNVEVTEKENSIHFGSVTAIDSLKTALEKAVNSTKEKETLYILATYSAMLEVRELLIGKKLL